MLSEKLQNLIHLTNYYTNEIKTEEIGEHVAHVGGGDKLINVKLPCA
jgi:hypothetical protein